MNSIELRNYLYSIKDDKYKDFVAKMNPSVCNTKIIGVRTPELRKIAKNLANDNEYLCNKLFEYREEILIYGFVIGYKKIDIHEKLKMLDEYLLYANSWETVDLVIFGIKDFSKQENLSILFNFFEKKTKEQSEFVVRGGIIGLLRYFLIDGYIDKVVEIIKNIKSDKYYINMAISWCVAEILCKDYSIGKKLLKSKELSVFVQNKAIQKARESLVLNDFQKKELIQYKI